MSTPGLISHDDEQDRRRLRKPSSAAPPPMRRRPARVPVARARAARARGRRHLQVRLKAAIRIDLRRRERQDLPLDHRRGGAFEDRRGRSEMSPTVDSMSASVGTTSRTVPSGSRFAAAATASARTGEVAPLMRWRGDCSPVSRRTPVSSDRNASDGALDIPCPADYATSRAFYCLTADSALGPPAECWTRQ